MSECNSGCRLNLIIISGKSKSCYRLVGGSGVNYQLLSRSPRLKLPDIIWMDSVEPEYEVSDVKNERVKIRVHIELYHYLRQS